MSEVRRNLPFLAVKEEDIDIGTMIQFAAAQFSQPKNREIGPWSTAPAAQLCIPVLINFSQANFRQERQLERCLLQRGGFGYFAQRDPDHFASLPKPKRAKVFGGNRIASRALAARPAFRSGCAARNRSPDGSTKEGSPDVAPSARSRCLKPKSGAGVMLLREEIARSNQAAAAHLLASSGSRVPACSRPARGEAFRPLVLGSRLGRRSFTNVNAA